MARPAHEVPDILDELDEEKTSTPNDSHAPQSAKTGDKRKNDDPTPGLTSAAKKPKSDEFPDALSPMEEFMIAFDNHESEKITLLLRDKLGINDRNEKGETPLIYAISDKKEKYFKKEEGLEKERLRKKKLQIVEQILNHGAEINVVDGNGITPFMHAFYRGEEDVSRALIKSGVVNLSVDDRRSLEERWEEEDDKLASWIVQLNMVLKHEEYDDAQVPLMDFKEEFMIAFNNHDLTHITSLLQDTSKINDKDNEGKTLLMHVILDKEKKYDQKDKKLHRQKMQITQLLLTNGAEINVSDLNNDTTFIHAFISEDLDACRELLKHTKDRGGSIIINPHDKELIEENCDSKEVQTWLEQLTVIDVTKTPISPKELSPKPQSTPSSPKIVQAKSPDATVPL